MEPSQCRMALAALRMGVRDLAALSGVGANTVARFMRGETLKPQTVDKIRAALEGAGVVFIAANGGGAGVRMAERCVR
ncbi:LacI family DNA-binding transcriptional regulator [Limibaculum sp. FT325]|uniref:LacI family DNA-binding transcriptional regulator n=1 Tax=Thermohalobaculum sediminis TaxID=2939436 RepID=UPI0020C016E7|nr:LacI family DNA-binding transcriptional regulator [Limibaculum sediminis]MCL5778528.1 LacI family DNA-binding transcriptional regulator [Limibaculum sediminis]